MMALEPTAVGGRVVAGSACGVGLGLEKAAARARMGRWDSCWESGMGVIPVCRRHAFSRSVLFCDMGMSPGGLVEDWRDDPMD
ncbi:MAG: hypothetical protein HW380_3081 [Magnetococcales bacterium]|nr:hypothetical protein [Magnetococcales bacterium]